MASDTEKILLIYESNLNQLTAEHQKLHIEMQKTDVKAKATQVHYQLMKMMISLNRLLLLL